MHFVAAEAVPPYNETPSFMRAMSGWDRRCQVVRFMTPLSVVGEIVVTARPTGRVQPRKPSSGLGLAVAHGWAFIGQSQSAR
jgi:hypothetical protein